MYAYLIHKTLTSYKNTVPEAENQFELPTRSTINYKIIMKTGDFNTYKKNAKRIYLNCELIKTYL